MPETESPKAPSKKHMVVLWTAIATALGGTGIPKIVDMLDNKPDVQQVQAIVAKQLEALSREQPVTVEAILELSERLDLFEKRLAEYSPRRRVPKPAVSAMKPAAAPAVRKAIKVIRASPLKRLKKVPNFNMQQQLSLPLQEELDK